MTKQKNTTHKNLNWQLKIRQIVGFFAYKTPLVEILFISTFILIRWWNNSDFSYPSEVLLPIVLFGAFASAIFYVYKFILKSPLATHLAALSLIYASYVFQFVESSRLGRLIYGLSFDFLASPASKSIALFLFLFGLIAILAVLAEKLYKRISVLEHLQILKVLTFTVVFIFSFQLVRNGARLYEIRHQLNYKPAAFLPAPSPNQNISSKPDIYYIVFDRLTSPEILKQNFNFDSSELVNFLTQQGFVTRQNAYSNYPFTMSSVSSTMAMRYFPELKDRFGNDGKWQSAAPYRYILNNPPIAKALDNFGYQYVQVSSWWDFTRIGISADANPTQSFRLSVFGKHFYLSDLQRDIIYKSVLSPWLKKGAVFGNFPLIKYDLDRNPAENFESQMQALKNLSAKNQKTTPQFVFAHILVPHPPYVFDSNGNYPPYDVESNDNGVDETVKYTNELNYLTLRIKDLITHIRQNSPNAAIIIQSDEGPYPKEFRGPMSQDHYYDPLKLGKQQIKQKFGIFASYYMPETSSNEVAKINSSVNVFRFVLNRYFGYNLELLPDCHFATGNKFNIYNYTMVNQHLTGEPAPEECRQYE